MAKRGRGGEGEGERETDRQRDGMTFILIIQDRSFIPMGKNSKGVWAVQNYGSCHMSFQT
jgi:hypothetical protein